MSGTSSALVMLSFPRAAIDGLWRMGAVKLKRAASGKATQPAVRERSGRTGVDEPVMSASARPLCRWRAPGNFLQRLDTEVRIQGVRHPP